MSGTDVNDGLKSVVASVENNYSKVTVKAVGLQLALMTGISVATILAFSFFRPREKKVYAPKIKYQLPPPVNPADDPDYEPPPPVISNSFWGWLSPVIHLKEEQTTANVGLDAATFLRFLRLLRHAFSVISLIGVALLIINIVYNVKNVPSDKRNFLQLLTIANVRGAWVWPAVAASYLINFVIMYFVWRHWNAMIMLRARWFRSPAYQSKIYSRTLMVTQIRKDYRSDAGLIALMGLLKVDGIKIGPEIDCATIGRRIGDFPELVEEHNDAVSDLEKHLVKYLKAGKLGSKRPTVRKGGFLGLIGGQKHDAIDYYAKQIKFLREKIDAQRNHIESLRKDQRKWRKDSAGMQVQTRIEGENYGFVTFKTISEAHRIARVHHRKLKELHGARLHLAPMPQDIVWKNISKEPAEVSSRTTFGFILIGVVCFLNTIPLLFVSLLANLSSLTVWVKFLDDWSHAGQWGNWTFSFVSGVLPPIISFVFGYLLPITIRSISRYQGAPTRSRLDRAVTARYFAFIIISNLIVFSLLGVIYNSISEVVLQIGRHSSAKDIFNNFQKIPYQIQNTYVIQSTYWLTWLPLRGFLVIFELVQLVKLALVSVRRYMFSHTPRDIREMTKPDYFSYSVVIVNLLFVCAIGMIYAPLAPLVAFGACIVFWFSSVVYKYQLLYVWISRAESGGRMWNVYCNRLLVCCVLMQLLMILTTGLVRRRWLDTIAAAPPVLLILAFKIWIRKAYGDKFRYFEPTPQEAEQERRMSMNEKRTRVSEMEKRFLHPALHHDKLYKIMVHKSQESLAREVLSAYPWFGDKYDSGLIKIKGVREDNLEYDPARDGPRDEAHQNDWDTRSHASTDMLGGMMTNPPTPSAEDMYKQYPSPDSGYPYPYKSPGAEAGLLPNNPSTDHLLTRDPGGSDVGYGNRSDLGGYSAAGSDLGYTTQPLRDESDPEAYGRQQRFIQGMGMSNLHSRSQESITGVPLLQHAQQVESERRGPYTPRHQSSTSSGGSAAPYPPTSYPQPPTGYTPPGADPRDAGAIDLRSRSGSDLSYGYTDSRRPSGLGANTGMGIAMSGPGPAPWDSSSDVSTQSRSRQQSVSQQQQQGVGYGLPPGARMGYADDTIVRGGMNGSPAPTYQSRQGSTSGPASTTTSPPRRQSPGGGVAMGAAAGAGAGAYPAVQPYTQGQRTASPGQYIPREQQQQQQVQGGPGHAPRQPSYGSSHSLSRMASPGPLPGAAPGADGRRPMGPRQVSHGQLSQMGQQTPQRRQSPPGYGQGQPQPQPRQGGNGYPGPGFNDDSPPGSAF